MSSLRRAGMWSNILSVSTECGEQRRARSLARYFVPRTRLLHASYTPVYTPRTRLVHTSYTPFTHLLHASYSPRTHLLHVSYTPLTRFVHASYTPATRLVHASYTPLTRRSWRMFAARYFLWVRYADVCCHLLTYADVC